MRSHYKRLSSDPVDLLIRLVDLLIRLAGDDHLPEKADEVLTGVPSRGLALNLTGLDVQRGVDDSVPFRLYSNP